MPNLAERGGFEPPVGCYSYDGLANRYFRPLSHLSVVIPDPCLLGQDKKNVLLYRPGGDSQTANVPSLCILGNRQPVITLFLRSF
jgi:hypothetical protein